MGNEKPSRLSDAPSGRPRRQSLTISFEGRELLGAQEVDEALQPGARNAIISCLGLRRGESMLLLVEAGFERIGAVLLHQAQELGVDVAAYLVDADRASNEAFVNRMVGRLGNVDASILVASVEGLPRPFRRRLITTELHSRRHAHMVGVTEQMMSQSMRGDYRDVEALGERLKALIKPNSLIRVSTATGTDLTVRCGRSYQWHNASGLQHQPGWSNLPGGELFSTPGSVDGVLVPDGGLWLPDGREIGRGKRLRLQFSEGGLVEAEGPESDALWAAVDSDPYGRRAGKMGFGTNTSVLTPIGALLQDLKMPGFHVTLGDTDGELTGASWHSDIEIPLLPRRPDVTVDDTPVLVRGRYARNI